MRSRTWPPFAAATAGGCLALAQDLFRLDSCVAFGHGFSCGTPYVFESLALLAAASVAGFAALVGAARRGGRRTRMSVQASATIALFAAGEGIFATAGMRRCVPSTAGFPVVCEPPHPWAVLEYAAWAVVFVLTLHAARRERED